VNRLSDDEEEEEEIDELENVYNSNGSLEGGGFEGCVEQYLGNIDADSNHSDSGGEFRQDGNDTWTGEGEIDLYENSSQGDMGVADQHAEKHNKKKKKKKKKGKSKASSPSVHVDSSYVKQVEIEDDGTYRKAVTRSDKNKSGSEVLSKSKGKTKDKVVIETPLVSMHTRSKVSSSMEVSSKIYLSNSSDSESEQDSGDQSEVDSDYSSEELGESPKRKANKGSEPLTQVVTNTGGKKKGRPKGSKNSKNKINQAIAAPNPIAEIELELLQRTYVCGLYQIHHTWVEPMRVISKHLLQTLVESGNPEEQERSKTAFFVFPSLIKVMSMCKLQRPITFLHDTAAKHNEVVEIILREATDMLETYREVRRRVSVKRNMPADHLSIASRRDLARRSIQVYCAVGRFSAAANVLK
jgi:hypothetical protein